MNIAYIAAPTGPHSKFSAQEGAIVQSFNPVRYYRVREGHFNWRILECSILARRPKKLQYVPAPVTRVFDSFEDAKKAHQPCTRSEPLDPDRIEQLRLDVHIAISKMDFGPKQKGRRTAYIICFLAQELTPAQVVHMMQVVGFTSFTSVGAVMQRRRGLRIKGWEIKFAEKHGITIPDDI